MKSVKRDAQFRSRCLILKPTADEPAPARTAALRLAGLEPVLEVHPDTDRRLRLVYDLRQVTLGMLIDGLAEIGLPLAGGPLRGLRVGLGRHADNVAHRRLTGRWVRRNADVTQIFASRFRDVTRRPENRPKAPRRYL